jgi:hypothetical protein
MATDYISAGANQIWTLLRGRTLFPSKVRPGNQQTFLSGIKWPERANRQAADLPEAKMRVASSQQQGYAGQGTMKTFANAAAGDTTADFVVDDAVVYEMTITYDGVDQTLPDQILIDVKAALFNAGCKLGLSNVKMWGPITARNDQRKDGSASGTLRHVQTITIPITYRLHRADLIGQ